MMSKVLLPEETHKTCPILMKTKLFVPQAQELLPRPRLTQELDKGLKYRLNLVLLQRDMARPLQWRSGLGRTIYL